MGDVIVIMSRPVIVIVALSLLCACATATNEEGTKYLEENKSKDGVITLPSGLQYKVLKKGDGAFHPTVSSPCECHYEGTLIKGWTEAMQLMVEGDKWEMYIPSDLAYGERGSPPKIPGGSALVFRMEIIKIKGDKKPALTCDPATLDGCDDKEKAFVEKMKAATPDKLKAELKRLTGMNGSSMKPELQQWMMRRINVLTKMTKEL